MRLTIFKLIESIDPFDEQENQDIQNTLSWIASDAEIFRIEKPNIPEQHLVSYFVVLDPIKEEILLVDHKRAGVWLPPGGHIEINEHPRTTVLREAEEELGLTPDFLQETPFFLTQTYTTGKEACHLDVSLWYIIRGCRETPIHYCATEFKGIKWFSFDEIPYEKADIHLRRFINKFKQLSK